MRAVDQWSRIEEGLPERWEEARIGFVAEDARAASRAAAVLGPLGPGRVGDQVRFHVLRSGGSGGPHAVRNLLSRLDRNRIWGTLTVLETRVAEPPQEPPPVLETRRPSLVEAWDAALRALPPDWSDLLCELELDSSDYLAHAALLGAPLNPTRNPQLLALRFRVSGKRGYGASIGMTRRCLERMDAEVITGTLTVLNALSGAENVGTQGPVWRIAGHSV